MSDMKGAGLAQLVEEIKLASANIRKSDDESRHRLDGMEANINELFRKTQRPGGFVADDDAGFARKSATEMCHIRRALTVPKDDGMTKEYVPGSSEIDEAMAARRAFTKMLRHGDESKLDPTEQKSLSSFSFGSTGFLLPPERSIRLRDF